MSDDLMQMVTPGGDTLRVAADRIEGVGDAVWLRTAPGGATIAAADIPDLIRVLAAAVPHCAFTGANGDSWCVTPVSSAGEVCKDHTGSRVEWAVQHPEVDLSPHRTPNSVLFTLSKLPGGVLMQRINGGEWEPVDVAQVQRLAGLTSADVEGAS